MNSNTGLGNQSEKEEEEEEEEGPKRDLGADADGGRARSRKKINLVQRPASEWGWAKQILVAILSKSWTIQTSRSSNNNQERKRGAESRMGRSHGC